MKFSGKASGLLKYLLDGNIFEVEIKDTKKNITVKEWIGLDLKNNQIGIVSAIKESSEYSNIVDIDMTLKEFLCMCKEIPDTNISKINKINKILEV